MIVEALSGPAGALALGFVIGMAHALEADHLAAVGTMLRGKDGLRRMATRGAVWGLGHTLSLFGMAMAVLALGLTISGRTEALLELGVGIMIVALGARVLWRLRRDRVHIHVHDHDGARHLHAHSHADGTAHDHGHAATLGIGLMHGLAGSAGLLVLTLAATDSTGAALAYVLAFGLGSVAGMAALTAALSLPLSMVERGATWLRSATMAAIGLAAIFVGTGLATESLRAIGG